MCSSDLRILEIEIPQTPAVKLKKDGSRTSTEEKVFPGYVLVRMVLDEDTMMAVRSTPNVINFVGAEDRRATGKARGHIKPRPLSRQEVDRIFKRVPLALGFSCEFREPGAYRALTVCGVPVIMVRGQDNVMRSFVNMCSHQIGRAHV